MTIWRVMRIASIWLLRLSQRQRGMASYSA
jgi:hypothetical protein